MVLVLLPAVFSGCIPPIHRSPGAFVIDHTDTDAGLIPESVIAEITGLDVYFEHASVGTNMMDGVAALESDTPSRYTIDRTDNSFSTWFVTDNGIGENPRGNPGRQEKIDYFVNSMTTDDFANLVDVAMFKFCYIDDDREVVNGTAAQAFTAYQTAMESLETAYPDTAFIWWTMPIETTGNEWKDDYNNLVRDYCIDNGKILFDLADIECYTTAGVHTTDNGYEAMVGDFTSDGGHLNAAGSSRAAQAFWVLLAGVCGYGL